MSVESTRDPDERSAGPQGPEGWTEDGTENGGPEGGADGPFTAAAEWLTATSRWARHVIELGAEEARLAAVSGITMVVLMIVCAACVVMAWAFTAVVAAYGLVVLGLPWPAAGLSLAAAHLLAAYLLWRITVRLSRSLTLPELRRSLLSEDY